VYICIHVHEYICVYKYVSMYKYAYVHIMMMIAFITYSSSLVSLTEGLCSANPWEFELLGFIHTCICTNIHIHTYVYMYIQIDNKKDR